MASKKPTTEPSFESTFKKIGDVTLPLYEGKRIMMMPVIIGDDTSIPDVLGEWKATLTIIAGMVDPQHHGKVGYLTLDEKVVAPGATHRRPGKHVDGMAKDVTPALVKAIKSAKETPAPSSGLSGYGGGWGSIEHGMITVASHPGCRAWRQEFRGWPGVNGECDHLQDQLIGEGHLFGAGEVYWLDGLCVHESVALTETTPRQFVRLSLPSTAPWFEGYTINPLGVLPTGKIMPRRAYMDL